jgi:hypothetical protein
MMASIHGLIDIIKNHISVELSIDGLLGLQVVDSRAR